MFKMRNLLNGLLLFMCAIMCFSFLLSCQKNETAYLDASLPVSKRVDNLLSLMTLEEKVGQLCQYVSPKHLDLALTKDIEAILNSDTDANYGDVDINDILNKVKAGEIGSFLHVKTPEEANLLQSFALKSRLKIPLIIATDAIHGHGMSETKATIFPSSIGMSCTFDTLVMRDMARIIAKELRACGFQWNFYPNIDVARNPQWGRIEETFGEDQGLVSDFGVIYVKGLQEGNADPNENVAACIKHYIAGSSPYNGLNFAPEDVSEWELRELWLPPYVACIKAGAKTLMAAHNTLNGIPCHANDYLLHDILKKELNFKGFVVSDWTDIGRLHTIHKISETPYDASVLGLKSGIDMHMHGPGYFEHIVEAVNKKDISMKQLDDAVRRILQVKFELGIFENSIVDTQYISEKVLTKEHLDVALDAAKKSIVLLQNKNNTLPIHSDAKVFLAGPAADSHMILGDWVLSYNDVNIETIKTALEEKIGKNNLIFQPVGNIWTLNDDDIKKSVQAAKNSDVIVVAVGENSVRNDSIKRSCGENADRADLILPGMQEKLILELSSLGKPVVVVLVTGRPLVLNNFMNEVGAIVNAWCPGLKGGEAIAQVVMGEFNPQGRLTVSFPKSVGSVRSFYSEIASANFKKFMDSNNKTHFPFGFGLSYTDYEYLSMKVDPKISKGQDVVVDIELANTGKMDGVENVLLYFNDEYSSVVTPEKKLIAYQPVSLKAGESKKVTFSIPFDKFSLLNRELKWVVEPGNFKLMIYDGKNKLVQTADFEVIK
jgi:beta-glucosidase